MGGGEVVAVVAEGGEVSGGVRERCSWCRGALDGVGSESEAAVCWHLDVVAGSARC